MSDSNIPEIKDILTEVDTLLRERLKALGVESEHVLFATLPDGAGVFRSNVGPEVFSNGGDADGYCRRGHQESAQEWPAELGRTR